jgi:hypothetical protein
MSQCSSKSVDVIGCGFINGAAEDTMIKVKHWLKILAPYDYVIDMLQMEGRICCMQ